MTGALDATVAALLRLLGSRAKVDFATNHMRVLSLAIASSVVESIVHHARAVKSAPGRAATGDRHARRLHLR